MTEDEKERIIQIMKEVYAKHGKKLQKEWELSNEIKGVWIEEAQFIEDKQND